MSVRKISKSELIVKVEEVLEKVLEFEKKQRGLLSHIHPHYLQSAKNLLEYIALRQIDLRELQWQLSRVGLSSLGRSESFVVSNLIQVLDRLSCKEVNGTSIESMIKSNGDDKRIKLKNQDMDEAEALLHQNTRNLLGEKPENRHVSIMVTADTSTPPASTFLSQLLQSGMNCLRINGAHGTMEEWNETIQNLKISEKQTQKKCKILFDLPGPKIRTWVKGDPIKILKIKPKKNELGIVIDPQKVELIPTTSKLSRDQRGGVGSESVVYSAPCIEVSSDFFYSMVVGSEIHFIDARNKKRKWAMSGISPGRATALVFQTCVLVEETEFFLAHQKISTKIYSGFKLLLPSLEVYVGSEIKFMKKMNFSLDANESRILYCTLPEAIKNLEMNQRVLIDDGKVQARVVSEGKDGYVLKVEKMIKPMFKIKSDKGVNLPDTKIDVPAFTQEDREIFEFATKNADLIGLSFVKFPKDLEVVIDLLKAKPKKGLVLKVETLQAVENLPALLLKLMEHEPVGIMIARGDLAVECGFERMAELQEEILWLCEAAHLPAIWATQVLENLAQTALPSRAEITDAAMSVRAECVMLNKGLYINQAVRTLDNILRRMEAHQYKKKTLYRPLKISKL